ncbi:platelet-activating factor acetylhydrolase, isoform II-domain-containing protein [Lasiosphaeria hispida]|uniref:Putative phospholipase n=1 Tax=Lasiosphaeria hispida TaxID=260671 RepID=A0AAJ0HQZ9_9PEZI|nr:platelet-activating factor acetylhydrolase, isoform II-domain-containing protein [Lasiosphaeria hispida]
MASFLSRLSPVPAFPEYTGPHKVGTVDVEIPVSGLNAPSPTPEGASDIHTVQFRVFYPAVPESHGKRITWLPAPQRQHISAYSQFLGAGNILASVLSFLPRHLHFTSIPVHKNATALHPAPEAPHSRWPTVIFSHGLGGNRNAYSHLAGSLASHGVVVVCPEHRDGSAALSLIRDPKNQDRSFTRSTRQMVPYVRIPHTQTTEIWEARDKQLRVRLWELGLGFEAILGLDRGDEALIRSNLNNSTPATALSQFTGILDIHEPGRIIFAGHSFGAATMVQLLKSTYYASRASITSMAHPLFTPRPSSALVQQINPSSPLILLDMWCFPLLSAATAPLYRLPLPCYASPSAPGGSAILAVESEGFYKWTDHLHTKARILSPEPSHSVVTPDAFARPDWSVRLAEPYFFYVQHSAHLNQSDFGVLFPWLTKRVFGAEQPERCLRLNLRAQLQFLRGNGYNVARTWVGDLVDGVGQVEKGGDGSESEGSEDENKGLRDGVSNDRTIFYRSAGDDGAPVEAWRWIDIVGLGEKASPSELELLAGARDKKEEAQAEEGERKMEGEMEPSLAGAAPLAEGAKKAVHAAEDMQKDATAK